jgi:ribosome maturation protein Sdo1
MPVPAVIAVAAAAARAAAALAARNAAKNAAKKVAKKVVKTAAKKATKKVVKVSPPRPNKIAKPKSAVKVVPPRTDGRREYLNQIADANARAYKDGSFAKVPRVRPPQGKKP